MWFGWRCGGWERGGGGYPLPQTTLPASQVGPGAWHLLSDVQVLPDGQ